jgi:hypothetical protein
MCAAQAAQKQLQVIGFRAPCHWPDFPSTRLTRLPQLAATGCIVRCVLCILCSWLASSAAASHRDSRPRGCHAAGVPLSSRGGSNGSRHSSSSTRSSTPHQQPHAHAVSCSSSSSSYIQQRCSSRFKCTTAGCGKWRSARRPKRSSSS